jgi:uncharacterized SAM-binding protein YcdF (DUF218 family)
VSPAVEADTGVVVILVATKIIANVKIVAAIMRWMLCSKSVFLLLLSLLLFLLLFSVFILRTFRMRTSDKRLPPLDR